MIEVTPYVGALIWGQTEMAEAIASRLDKAPQAPTLSTFCDAIARGDNDLIHSFGLMMEAEILDQSCPPTPGIGQAPPVCILRSTSNPSLARLLVEAGASIDPPGGC